MAGEVNKSCRKFLPKLGDGLYGNLRGTSPRVRFVIVRLGSPHRPDVVKNHYICRVVFKSQWRWVAECFTLSETIHERHHAGFRSEEHTSELQSLRHLV